MLTGITVSRTLRCRRRGFLFTMPLMLGMGILVFSSMIAISQMFVGIGGPMVPDLLADMPTIFNYAEDGSRIPQYVPILDSEIGVVLDGSDGAVTLSEEEFAERFPSLAMYGLMVKIALGIFVVLLMLAGISYFFEEFNVVRQGTAYGIIAKLVILVPIYLILPYLWDMTALVIESSSLYLMDPFGHDPHGRTTELWCMMGSVACSIDGTTSMEPINIFDDIREYDRDSTLSQDSWSESLQDPIFGEDFMINVLLSLFKGFAVMFMTAMMFVLSAIRVMMTEVIIISFPLVAAIGLIPWINTHRIADMFQQNLIGLAMAPIMSAIVLSIGLSTIDAQNMPPLRMWFQLLSVGFLSVFFPVMLSPMLGNLSTKVGNMVSTSITSASVAGSGGLKGAVHGASQASSAMRGLGAVPGAGIRGDVRDGVAYPGAYSGGAGVDGGGRFTSANVGSSTSGASLGRISALDKAKVYGKAGMAGFLGGLGSGMVQSTTGAMGVGGAASEISGQMTRAGDSHIHNTAKNVMAGGTIKNVTSHMARIESAGSLSQYVPVRDGSTLMNPGTLVDSMGRDSRSFDAGQDLLHNDGARQKFSEMIGQEYGAEHMPPETRAAFDKQLAEQIAAHPTAAGKIRLDMGYHT